MTTSKADVERALLTSGLPWVQLQRPGAVARFLRALAGGEPARRAEHDEVRLFALFFDPQRRLFDVDELSEAPDSLAIVRCAARAAVHRQASCLLLAIPRAKGTISPRPEDFALTRALFSVCEVLGIVLLDIVFAADDEYYSFRESGMIPEKREWPEHGP